MNRRRVNPGAFRDMQQRARQRRLEEAARASAPLRRREELTIPGANGYTQRVFRLYGARCLVCGAKAVHAHHVIPKRTIVARGQADYPLVYDARNGFPICVRCHGQHEHAMRRIWRHELLRQHVTWARDNGFEWVLDRCYPVRAL